MIRPTIFANTTDQKYISLIEEKKPLLVDYFDNQVKELAEVDIQSKPDTRWVYYPWKNTIVKLLDKDNFRKVRLSRNQNLITREEQDSFIKMKIGIAGLNVGNPGAICIALEGGSERMKLADFDILSLSNLNRFRASLTDLGANKAILSAQQIYEIDPYYDLEMFENGIDQSSLENFLLSPKIDLLIEETDNLKLKLDIRYVAKKHRIPVLMVTGNGAGLIIDIERYDTDPELKIMNGYLKDEVIDAIYKVGPDTPKDVKIALARDFMGEKFLTERLQTSFKLVGKGLAGIPQIAESSFMRGAALAYYSRKFNSIQSGRYLIALEANA